MNMLKNELDKNLLDLTWSLWTELGVSGIKKSHPNVLILVEELVIFTSVLSEIDPRLRDESIDWCSQFHRFISVSRLKSLLKDFEELIKEPFSQYASTLNSLAKTKWPIFIKNTPGLNIKLSRKSVLRPYGSAALLNIRARSVFGTGARADILTFFLVHPKIDLSIAEVAEIGYSKRNLAEILDDLHFGNLFDRFMQGNQQRYRLKNNSSLFQILDPIPQFAPSWHLIFKILLSLRICIQRIENYAESTKVVELRSCLKKHEKTFQKLGISPPSFHNDFTSYLDNFKKWLIDWTSQLAEGVF